MCKIDLTKLRGKRQNLGVEVSLATKLKELRIRKSESLQTVADAVGVSKAHIWELEKGSSKNPGLELLIKISLHFGIPVAFLADESAKPENAAAQQFFRELEGELSEKDWDALRMLAERLKDRN